MHFGHFVRFCTIFSWKLMKMRPKLYVSAISYDFFMNFYENEAKTVRFGHFVRFCSRKKTEIIVHFVLHMAQLFFEIKINIVIVFYALCSLKNIITSAVHNYMLTQLWSRIIRRYCTVHIAKLYITVYLNRLLNIYISKKIVTITFFFVWAI